MEQLDSNITAESKKSARATEKDSKFPSNLSFSRTVSMGHVLMYSARSAGEDELAPVLVREEPLRGLNATTKTEEEKKQEAVLQVVESAELRPGHSFLVLKTHLTIEANHLKIHACNQPSFEEKHQALVQKMVEQGLHRDLALRYAVTLASGDWCWRNAAQARAVEVRLTLPGGETLTFTDLIPDEKDPFTLANYPEHEASLLKLAAFFEKGLESRRVRCHVLDVTAVLHMGLGARVYPSQEWSSESMKRETEKEWKGGSGVTRILAKMPTASGELQAFINDRKAGNRLRAIDTWHGVEGVGRVPVELFGANSHEAKVLRKNKNSFFALAQRVSKNEELSKEEALFYLAAVIRGGVFGASDKGGNEDAE